MDRTPMVYILASQKNGTIYTGVTSNPLKRLYEHRTSAIRGFTALHRIKRLVHFEMFDDMTNAIAREKQVKNWKREWKIALIEKGNPDWSDLAPAIGLEPLTKLKPVVMDAGSSPA